MKNYVLGFLFFGLTNLMFAQDELVTININDHALISTHVNNTNELYLNSMTDIDMSKKILKLQDIVANYNIQLSKVYRKNSLSTYTVNFKEGNNKLIAVYDRDGQLISSQEKYQSIKLPYSLSSNLIKLNRGWGIEQVFCNIEYNKNVDAQIVYKVILKKGKETKKITIGA